jgi:hypothetical protein
MQTIGHTRAWDERDLALRDLKSWVDIGKLIAQEDVIGGLEPPPRARIGLLTGEGRADGEGKRRSAVRFPRQSRLNNPMRTRVSDLS